jgi:hypothetical protein
VPVPRPATGCLWALLVLAGCAEPPNKEVDRAQGAIDAARAAGAEQYATTAFQAATSALGSAHTAISAGDYRLALSYALASHEHAQNAARETADTKARVRVDVERSTAEVDALIGRTKERLAAAERARVPRTTLTKPTQELATAAHDLQEAREAAAAGEYLKANAALEGLKPRVDGIIAALDAAVDAQPVRRRP